MTAPSPRTSPTTALVVFESMFGNTRTIADAVNRGLELGGCESALCDVADLPLPAPRTDLLVVGGPTHAFSLSRPSTRLDAVHQGAMGRADGIGLRAWLDALVPEARSGGCAAAFDTRAAKARHTPVSAASAAARRLHRHGYTVLDHPTGFVVEDLDGPLLPGEVERAVTWGLRLAEAARVHVVARDVRAAKATR